MLDHGLYAQRGRAATNLMSNAPKTRLDRLTQTLLNLQLR
jgi:hypothetical protein